MPQTAAASLFPRLLDAGWNGPDQIIVVVPGQQAGRSLMRRLRDQVVQVRRRIPLPQILTRSALTERLIQPKQPVAAPLDVHCAWLQAMQRCSEDVRAQIAPLEAADLAAARSELMAHGWTLADAAERCAALPRFCRDPRWPALAEAEGHYRRILQQAGLQDRDDALRDDVPDPHSVSHIVLVGVVDLTPAEKALLQRCQARLTVMIVAPAEMEVEFDDFGGLVCDDWAERPVPLHDSDLHVCAAPTAEAQQVAAQALRLLDREGAGSVLIGVGDEEDADGLIRRLYACGVPTRSPYGQRLSRSRPAIALQWIRDYLILPSAQRFAALLRHPDLETCLDPLSDEAPSLPEALDTYLASALPEHLPTPERLPERIAPAVRRLDHLLSPLQPVRPLHEWAAPITILLEALYPAEMSGEGSADHALFGAITVLQARLQEIAAVTPDLAPALDGPEILSNLLDCLQGRRSVHTHEADGIEMLGWLELAWSEAPNLILTGFHEGAVPRRPAPDPLLPDTLRRTLGLPDRQHHQARDAYLLRLMRESRTEISVYVARRGVDGEPRRPSRLLFLCDGETAARRVLQFSDPDDDQQPEPPLFRGGTERQLSPPRPEPLSTPITQLRVTAFRDYLSCPYRFYLRHVLKLQEISEDFDEMNGRQFGELIHECLAALAPGPVADSADPEAIREFLRAQLRAQTQQRFGPEPPAAVRLQIRQAGRRLDAFAEWQARQSAEGWRLQTAWAERDVEATIMVDHQPFLLTGRIDRIDFHPQRGQFRIMDYKTNELGTGPEARHRGKADAEGHRPWTDLQLPLYRVLAEASGIDGARLEVGYALLPADLNKTGHELAEWTADDLAEALASAEDVIRALRAERFWPPAALTHALDAFGALCFDRIADRDKWINEAGS